MEWKRGVIAFGRAQGHPVKEVAEFAQCINATIILIHKQKQNSQNANNPARIVDEIRWL